jgi:hypothetical protein
MTEATEWTTSTLNLQKSRNDASPLATERKTRPQAEPRPGAVIDQLVSVGVECFSMYIGDAVWDACGGVALVGTWPRRISASTSKLFFRVDPTGVVDRQATSHETFDS